MKKFLLMTCLLGMSVTSVLGKDACKLSMLDDGVYEYFEGFGSFSPEAVGEVRVLSENSIQITILEASRTSSFKNNRVYRVRLVDNSRDFDCQLELYNEDDKQIVALDNTRSDNFNVNDFKSRGYVLGNSRFILSTSGFSTFSSETGGGVGTIRGEFKKVN